MILFNILICYYHWLLWSIFFKTAGVRFVVHFLGRQFYSHFFKLPYVSPSHRPVRQGPDRSIRLPDRPRSFNNLGPVRLNLVYCWRSFVCLVFNLLQFESKAGGNDRGDSEDETSGSVDGGGESPSMSLISTTLLKKLCWNWERNSSDLMNESWFVHNCNFTLLTRMCLWGTGGWGGGG